MASIAPEPLPQQPRRASPSAQPLLHNFVTAGFADPKENSNGGVVRSLQDASDSGSEPDFNSRLGIWDRCLMAVCRRRRAQMPRAHFESVRLPIQGEKGRWRKRWGARVCGAAVVFVVFFFGLVHIVNVTLGLLNPLTDDSRPAPWTSTPSAADLKHITRDVTPVPCHSHNDYWRRVPLFDALYWGCIGVEADVWLFDDELYVGHDTRSLDANKTLRSMYVDPLVAMLDAKNTANTSSPPFGIFDTSPNQTLILLIDFKNNGTALYPIVSTHLAPLRDRGYLTHYNGTATIHRPVTIVATGNSPFDLISVTTPNRDIFFDAPLATLDSTPTLQSTAQGTTGTTPSSIFNTTTSFYASADMRAALGSLPWFGRFSASQLETMRSQIRAAHQRGLLVRYWGTPTWPAAVRLRVWDTLIREGTDVINADQLAEVAGGPWRGRWHGGWLG